MILPMATFTLILALLAFLLFLVLALVFARGQRSMTALETIPPPAPGEPRPRVTLITTALNEELHVEEALRSFLAQDYDNLEIIAIDDRSTDRTGAILDAVAARNPRLRVIHITELPEGWLGKNHALWRGAREAGGEILLFIDGDVVLEPTAVGRAVAAMERRGLDHLALFPRIIARGAALSAFIGAFGIFFLIYAQPWLARNPRSRRFIGIGAFNMVRRAAYLACGTHQAIAMRPDDDMKLGKLIKRAGGRQECMLGCALAGVEWYGSLGEAVRGLTKNAFAGVEYSLAAVLGATAFMLTFYFWPLPAIFLTAGWARGLSLAAYALMILLCADTARFHRGRRWHGLLLPLASLVFLYAIWRSTVLTLWHRGIIWRGTHYPLEKLKANRV